MTTMVAHSTELAHLETSRAKLAGVLEEFRSLSTQQTQLTGSKQQVSKRMEELFVAGNKLANLLRVGLREHYGNRSEKLVDFSVPPFRGRKRSTEAKPPEEPGTTPPAPTPTAPPVPPVPTPTTPTE